MDNLENCPFCGEELQLRYFEWSEDIAGVYCDICNKFRYDDEYRYSDEPEWEDGTEDTTEYPWYGTT